MKYQLVIQFPEELFDDINAIADMEDKIDESMVDAEVDGHDIGSGEINFFIHTNHPADTFKVVKSILENEGVNFEYVKITYREIANEHYIVLWPDDLTRQ
jgi:hypothetical protein